MAGAPIEAINEALPELHHEIAIDPRVSDKAQFGVIGFSTTAEILLPLSDLSEVEDMPELTANGTTNYGGAFALLRETIQQDVKRLRSEQHTVYRPVVFFLSDGLPTDGGGNLSDSWTDAYDELVSQEFTARPNIIAFGIGECDEAIISHVGTFKAFIQKDRSASPVEALREFAASLTKSIVRSASRQDVMAQPRLYVDENIPGFVSLPLDEVDEVGL